MPNFINGVVIGDRTALIAQAENYRVACSGSCVCGSILDIGGAVTVRRTLTIEGTSYGAVEVVCMRADDSRRNLGGRITSRLTKHDERIIGWFKL